MRAFADSFAGGLSIPGPLMFGLALRLLFYAHYAFASITAHCWRCTPIGGGISIERGAAWTVAFASPVS